MIVIQGKHVIRRNGRFFAVRKTRMGKGIIENIHARQGGGDAGWDRQMVMPACKVRKTRVTRHSHGPVIIIK